MTRRMFVNKELSTTVSAGCDGGQKSEVRGHYDESGAHNCHSCEACPCEGREQESTDFGERMDSKSSLE